MFEVFESIDERILALFTKFSHWFQRLTGRTNFFLARVCLFLTVTAIVTELLNYWFNVLSQKTVIIDVVVASGMVLLSAVYLDLLHEADKQTYSNSKVKPYIQRRFRSGSLGYAMVFVRMISVFMIISISPLFIKELFFEKLAKNVVWVLEVHTKLELVYVVSFLYFALVDPLPPGKSKVREWVEAIGAGLRKMVLATRPG